MISTCSPPSNPFALDFNILCLFSNKSCMLIPALPTNSSNQVEDYISPQSETPSGFLVVGIISKRR